MTEIQCLSKINVFRYNLQRDDILEGDSGEAVKTWG